MQGEREVAGLRCGEVLAELPGLLDGTLPAARVAALRAHVAGCNVCARFGDDYAALVATLRADAAPSLPPGVLERLRAELDRSC